jgi:hypothetical protein
MPMAPGRRRGALSESLGPASAGPPARQELRRLLEDFVEHPLGKPAGERVLLARMVAPDQRPSALQWNDRAMPESGPRLATLALAAEQAQEIRECEGAERHEDPYTIEQP